MAVVIVGGYRQVAKKHPVSVNFKHGVRCEEPANQFHINHNPLGQQQGIDETYFAIRIVTRFPE